MGVVLGLSHTRSQEGAQLLSCQIPKQEGQQKAWERFEKAGLPPRAQPKRGRVDASCGPTYEMAPRSVPCRMEHTHEKQQNFVCFRGYVYTEIAEGPGDGSEKTERLAAFLGGMCLGCRR